MAKKLLSFLGTNRYLQCNYCYEGKIIENVHYVQEAIVRLFCTDWSSNDEIVVFVTEEAYNTNWITGTSFEGEKIEGLQVVLSIFSQEKDIIVKHVKISNAQNENDIWSIFEAVVDSVNAGDEIIVDITHAFRTIPMLAVVMINYLQMVKNVTFKGLYYGAVESLGRISDIAKMEKKDRNAPIIDLSSFIYLQKFSNAVNNFMQYGDAKELSNIALNEVNPILKQSQGKDDIAKHIRGISNQLKSMTQNFAYCRGKSIIEYNYAKLYNDVLKLKDSFNSSLLTLKPLQPLLNKLLEKLQPFKDYDDIINVKKGILAAKWCLEHNLIQQSITILQESIITMICNRHKLDYQNREDREMISAAFYAKIKPANVKTSNSNKKEKDKYSERLYNDELVSSLYKAFNQLTQLRNDINHANFRQDNKTPDDIHNEIQQILQEVMGVIMK